MTPMNKQRTSYRRVNTYEELMQLDPRDQDARARALEAIAEARRLGISLTAAAKNAGTTRAKVLRFAGPAVERSPGGRYRVKASDTLYRRIRVISTAGVKWVDTWSSTEAERASAHASAIRAFGGFRSYRGFGD